MKHSDFMAMTISDTEDLIAEQEERISDLENLVDEKKDEIEQLKEELKNRAD